MIDFNARIKDALALASDTKVFQFGEDILKHAPDLFLENFPGKKALIVADGNTWVAAGEKVWSYFKGAGIECRKHLFGMEEFHADSRYSDEIG